MKIVKYTLGSGIALSSLLYYNRDKITNRFIVPNLHKCDPETAHNIAINLLSLGITPKVKIIENDSLKLNLWNKEFKNPIGLAAGFDKNAKAYKNLYNFGFSFVEVGTMTPLPQAGNPKPRIFRFENYIKNRCGLNNDGIDTILPRLQLSDKNILGVNLGINNETTSITEDFNNSICKVNDYCDYIVLNISCPNISHNLQDNSSIISNVIQKAKENSIKPILIKISSDIDYQNLKIIADISLSNKLDGIIIGNTKKCPDGGLSGLPIKNISSQAVKDFYFLSGGRIPIIGVGGIFTGEDAYQRIKDGASLVQIYSSFIFNGAETVNMINSEILDLLEKDGYSNISEVVANNHNFNNYIVNWYKYIKYLVNSY